jgi:hypothetical protein
MEAGVAGLGDDLLDLVDQVLRGRGVVVADVGQVDVAEAALLGAGRPDRSDFRRLRARRPAA